MTDGDKVKKAKRLRRLERRILVNHISRWPPLNIKDLAEDYGVSVPSIRRDLDELGGDGHIPLLVEENLIYVDEDWKVPVLPIILSLSEATALFLAARLLVRYSDEPNPAIISALDELADALPPNIASHVRRTSDFYTPAPDPAFAPIFAAIAQGWAEHRQVKISYLPASGNEPREHVISPYYIEPGPLGYAFYIIAHSSLSGRVSVFKMERIQNATLTADLFTLPSDFDPLVYLSAAWGVMGPDYIGQEPIAVRLRFSPAVARRVKETHWHPTQKLTDLPDGGCEMTVQVAETLEMLPWLRGWAHNIEVVEPSDLRDRIAAEARLTAAIYELAIIREIAGKESDFESLGWYDRLESKLGIRRKQCRLVKKS